MVHKTSQPPFSRRLGAKEFRHQHCGNTQNHNGPENAFQLPDQRQNTASVAHSGYSPLCLVKLRIRAHGIIHLPRLHRHRPLDMLHHAIFQNVQKLPSKVQQPTAQKVQPHQKKGKEEQMAHVPFRAGQLSKDAGGQQNTDIGISGIYGRCKKS